MVGAHSPLTLPFTVAVALVASYVVHELLRHGMTARARTTWLVAGGGTLGLGVTSVHFIGMLGYRVRQGTQYLPIAYDLSHIVLAVLVSAAGVVAALAVAGRSPRRHLRPVLAGVVLGAAIAATHFVAMTAMRLAARTTHDPRLTTTACLIAVVGAVAMVLWASRPLDEDGGTVGDWVVAALLGAATIVGTHFTAMAGLQLTPAAAPLRFGGRLVLATDGLAGLVAMASLLLFGLGAIALVLDRQSAERLGQAQRYERLYGEAEAARRAAEESERRFRITADSAPVLIWITRADRSCEYVNRAWLEYTGYAAAYAHDRGFVEAVHPDDRARREALLGEPPREGQSLSLEYRLRCHDGSFGWMLETAAPRTAADGVFAGYIGSCVDITRRKRDEDARTVTLDAARELAGSLDFDATLRHVTDLVVPRLADYCLIYLRDPDGGYRQVAFAHVDPAKRGLLARLGALHRPDIANPESPVGRVVASRQPVLVTAEQGLVPSVSSDPDVRTIHSVLAPHSYMVLPLVAHGELLGTLVLATTGPNRPYAVEEQAAAELIATRAALALDNARLYSDARRAGEEAVRAAGLEARLMRARLEALRAQLNPHFLFNALNTLTMLVRRGANADALRGIVSLSQLLRHALSELATLEAPLRAEVGLVENYLEIEQLRFRDRLRVSLLLAPETLEALVPSLVLQPLVENAIKHGIARRSEAGKVEIVARREEEALILEVRDDGPGFPIGWDAATSGGIGIANTRERLDRLYGGRARFHADNAPGGGAVVRVLIPFRTTPGGRGAVT
jgi:PAS domain S-box-containing protein